MTDWRAVAAGGGVGLVYLAVLALFPPLAGVGWAAVPLVLGGGLVAGATAGVGAGGGPRRSGFHGLFAGSLAGAEFAVAFGLALLPAWRPPGVFFALNYLLATNAGRFPVVATHGGLVVGAIGGVAWGVMAALGLYAGREAPQRRRALSAER